jgi:hypothetical protein
MTLPMIPWMRWRGHGWRPSLEMAASMVVPAMGVVALLETGVLEDVGLLMLVEHVVMFAAMFAVMIVRPEEYSHAHHAAATARPQLAVSAD